VARSDGDRATGTLEMQRERGLMSTTTLRRASLSDMLGDKFLQDDELVPGVKVGLILLTPEIAADFSKRIPRRQRNQSRRLIDKYTTDMLAKKWPFIGDAIRFNSDDELIDGQHRVEGVVETGVSIPTIVVFGLDNDAIVPMDSGKGRRFEDLLTMEEHIENAASVGSLTRRVTHWMLGNYGQENIARVINPEWLNTTPTNEQLWTVYRANKDELIECTRHGLSYSRFFKKSAGPAIFAFSWMLFGKIDVDARESFFHELKEGSGTNTPTPAIGSLRRKLNEKYTRTTKPKPWEWQHFIFQTWNRKLQGETTELRRPSYPAYNTVAKPFDPHADTRGPGWEPLPSVFGRVSA
jgi:hypothetical protein